MAIEGSADNLVRYLDMAHEDDVMEGKLAYGRYHSLMRDLSRRYGFPFENITAAFVSLSPNNDYIGNLRSLISLIEGVRDRRGFSEITISTYRHAGERAYDFLVGREPFLTKGRGLKISSFYRNIIDPNDMEPITVDGHISAAWQGINRLTMKEAIVKTRGDYTRVADALRSLAADRGLIGNQAQAIIWFARKRLNGVKQTPQLDLFRPSDDFFSVKIDDLRAYKRK